MSVEWFNFEHYPDPTAQAALVAMERAESEKTPRVYICSPLSGDVKRNMERACRYARFAFAQGKHPLAPHLYYPQFMDDGDPSQRGLGCAFALQWLARCTEVWVFGEKMSAGMIRELVVAARKEIPVKYFDAACREKKGKEKSE